MPDKPRVVVVGLDDLPPQVLFDRWLDELPAFAACVERGVWGPLESVVPPITVPAWTCMMSGYNAAQLGIYGFRHRKHGTYDGRYFATSAVVRHPRVWDRLGEAGYTSGLLAVPQTHPPRRLHGFSVSGFLAGSTRERYTFPATLAAEIARVVGDYRIDVEGFRSDDRDRILRECRAMTEQRFRLFRHFLTERPQDFMMLVEIGPDRMHHAFWRWTDPTHPRHESPHRYGTAIRDYYRLLDEELGRTLSLLDADTHLFIVSDHGAQAMLGGVCINELLQRHGWLVLKQEPKGPGPLSEGDIDFRRTRAWGWGGYCGRVFINLAGREPDGQVPAGDYEAFRSEVAAAMEALEDPKGRPMATRAYRPEDLWDPPAGDYPDLIVHFDGLRRRSIGSVGLGTLHTEGNDTGPDDANHAPHGVFVYNGPRAAGGQRRDDLRLLDVGPTILDLFGLPAPEDAAGRVMELGRGD